MLKIYLRNDLKMRKGKMAAQSAHAAMKLFFEVMKKTNDKMILESKNLILMENFINNPVVEIIMINSEEELNLMLDKSKPHSIVIDNGRTEFNGVKTVTCGAQGIFEESTSTEMVVPYDVWSDMKSKQVFVFNKNVPLSKVNACKLAVISCLNNVYSKLITSGETKYYNLNIKNEFNDWILNAFGKICLSVEDMDGFNSLLLDLEENNIKYNKYNYNENYCLCIEPKYPEEIDGVTGSLKLI